ncbi:glucose PTS transporter subunit IIA [Lactiplantibacillus daoliensis]|uniref:Glucose PTS transporter subunit IIA n=1 Tax=Lactiplantibacillus daoliensis TaxID=2559916 RepID=A0ABW1UD80_9LACO|nr:PTS glucose transporter subunit IIABC [Lactiplantibacillus daoliensis]
MPTKLTLKAPVSGQLKPITAVNDAVFASEKMGKGFAVEPTDGAVVAPVSGVISFIAPTKHALAILTTSGVEILLHLGLDTVTLNGAPFTWKVKAQQAVTAGESLGAMDLAAIEVKHLAATVVVVITNTVELAADLSPMNPQAVQAGDDVTTCEFTDPTIKPATGTTKPADMAPTLIKLVGGPGNIKNLIHCITRLRFYLADESLADDAAIKRLPGVIDVVKAGGQYQVVIGAAVESVYDAVMAKLDLKPTAVVKAPRPKGIWPSFKWGFGELVGVITATMMPIIGLLAGAGIVKGILAMAVGFKWLTATAPLYILISAIADGIFHFLPVILGVTAAKKLGSNQIVLATVGGVLVYPSLATIASSKTPSLLLFGVHFPIMNYAASVFPILVAAWLAVYLERWLKKVIPQLIASIFIPIIEVLILSALIILILGPAITQLSDWLANGIMAALNFNAIIGGAIYCAIFPVLVIFGLHWPLIPIIVNDLAVHGYSMLNAFSSVLMMGIAGGVFAVTLKTRQKQLKQIGFGATISQLCGVGEPAIYGVLLKYKRVFYMVTLANIFGGALAGALHLLNYGFSGGLIGFASFINPKVGIDQNFYNYIISHGLTFLVAFVLTWLVGFNDKMKPSDQTV